MVRSMIFVAAFSVAVFIGQAQANHISDETFDLTNARKDPNTGAVNGPWFNWGWSNFHPFGGNNPDWWGNSAALYSGPDGPGTSGVFFPGYGTFQGLSLEGIEYQLEVDLLPQVNFVAQIDVGIQWRGAGGTNEDALFDDTVTIDLTDLGVDPVEAPRGGYSTITAVFTAPAGAYHAVPIIQTSNIAGPGGAEHWCYVDNVKLNVVGNLVDNPGFETGSVEPWVLDGRGQVSNWGGNPNWHAWWWADIPADDPNFPGGATAELYQTGICGSAGNTYEISANIAFQPFWDSDIEIGFQWMAADDETQISESLIQIFPFGFVPTPYERFTYQAIAPAGTTFVRPIIRQSNVFFVPNPARDNTAPTDNIIVQLISGTEADTDNDGVSDCDDVCPGTVAGAPVHADGRPIADLNEDCNVDMLDFSILSQSFSGP